MRGFPPDFGYHRLVIGYHVGDTQIISIFQMKGVQQRGWKYMYTVCTWIRSKESCYHLNPHISHVPSSYECTDQYAILLQINKQYYLLCYPLNMMKIWTFGFVPFIYIYAGTQQSPLLDVALRILGTSEPYGMLCNYIQMCE